MRDYMKKTEEHGTVTKIYKIPVNGRMFHAENGMIIELDTGCIISLCGGKYSQFSVGQRVVHVTYFYGDLTNKKRTDYQIYDELSYGQDAPFVKTMRSFNPFKKRSKM